MSTTFTRCCVFESRGWPLACLLVVFFVLPPSPPCPFMLYFWATILCGKTFRAQGPSVRCLHIVSIFDNSSETSEFFLD